MRPGREKHRWREPSVRNRKAGEIGAFLAVDAVKQYRSGLEPDECHLVRGEYTAVNLPRGLQKTRAQGLEQEKTTLLGPCGDRNQKMAGEEARMRAGQDPAPWRIVQSFVERLPRKGAKLRLSSEELLEESPLMPRTRYDAVQLYYFMTAFLALICNLRFEIGQA